MGSVVLSQTQPVAGLLQVMSLDLNDAAMSGNVEEVIIRLNMGEDPNQKFYPRNNDWKTRHSAVSGMPMFVDSPHHFTMQCLVGGRRLSRSCWREEPGSMSSTIKIILRSDLQKGMDRRR